ncbi:MAG: hypothetical protein KKF77_10825 [Proteobacteria bacterium]|nr:hypothetical protein [Pseudomonadota bacterium]
MPKMTLTPDKDGGLSGTLEGGIKTVAIDDITKVVDYRIESKGNQKVHTISLVNGSVATVTVENDGRMGVHFGGGVDGNNSIIDNNNIMHIALV